MVGQVQRRLLGLMTVGDQARHEVHEEVPNASMTGVSFVNISMEPLEV